MTTNNFFIRDCNDRVVGNPNGYRTMRGAQAQQDNPKSAAYKAIWSAFENRKDKNDTHVCSISQF